MNFIVRLLHIRINFMLQMVQYIFNTSTRQCTNKAKHFFKLNLIKL